MKKIIILIFVFIFVLFATYHIQNNFKYGSINIRKDLDDLKKRIKKLEEINDNSAQSTTSSHYPKR